MWQRIKAVLRWLSVGLIAPSALSALLVGFFALDYQLGVVVGFIFGLITMAGAAGIEVDEKKCQGRAGFHSVWCALSAILFLVFGGEDSSISITRTTILIALITWALTSIDFVVEKLGEISEAKKAKEIEEQAAKQKAFVNRINNLIGDMPQTTSLLAAIERLTPYAKEEADHILGALSRDAERYIMLRSVEQTSSNDMLVRQSREEADEIAAAAKALWADSTEMALELLREHQAVEADIQLGRSGNRGSELARAHKDFKKFLEGLREVQFARPDTEEDLLRQEIDLLKPQTKVKELPVGKDKPRRLGSGN